MPMCWDDAVWISRQPSQCALSITESYRPTIAGRATMPMIRVGLFSSSRTVVVYVAPCNRATVVAPSLRPSTRRINRSAVPAAHLTGAARFLDVMNPLTSAEICEGLKGFGTT